MEILSQFSFRIFSIFTSQTDEFSKLAVTELTATSQDASFERETINAEWVQGELDFPPSSSAQIIEQQAALDLIAERELLKINFNHSRDEILAQRLGGE